MGPVYPSGKGTQGPDASSCQISENRSV